MKTYMNIHTGSVAPADEWTYTNENGVEVSAVELGELVEVVWNKEKDCWIEV